MALALTIVYYSIDEKLSQGLKPMFNMRNQVLSIAVMSLLLGACDGSGVTVPATSGGTNDVAEMSGAASDSNNGTTSAGTDDSGSSAAGNPSVEGASSVDGVGGGTQGAGSEGVGTTGGASEIVGAAAVPSIQGEWLTGCLETGAMFSQQTASVVGARMLTELSAYSDQDCTIAALLSPDITGSTMQRNATIVPTGETRTVSLGNAVEVNFYYEEATIDNKPLPSIAFPGRDEYVEKIEYDIVLVQNDVLYFGDSTDTAYSGMSVDARPISIDTLIIFNRVP